MFVSSFRPKRKPFSFLSLTVFSLSLSLIALLTYLLQQDVGLNVFFYSFVVHAKVCLVFPLSFILLLFFVCFLRLLPCHYSIFEYFQALHAHSKTQYQRYWWSFLHTCVTWASYLPYAYLLFIYLNIIPVGKDEARTHTTHFEIILNVTKVKQVA